jgi:hypothetical protein
VLLCKLNNLLITLLNPTCIYVCVCCILSEFYTIEASALLIEVVNSYFHLYGCGYHHNRIDEVPLIAGTPVIVDDIVEVYL